MTIMLVLTFGFKPIYARFWFFMQKDLTLCTQSAIVCKVVVNNIHVRWVRTGMDAKVAISIEQIVEAALKGETDVAAAYAMQLKERLAEIGEKDTALRIGEHLSGKKARRANVTRLSRVEAKPIIPVDSESRMPVADEVTLDANSMVRLPADAAIAIERFVSCVKHSDQLESRGVKTSASLLMHGPPGCGKTMAAHRVAAELGLPLLVARADSLISSYLGSTSKNIRMLFEYAAQRRCVLFLDEFDSIAKMRDDQRELGELKRVVISLLQNIDANGKQYVLIAATNHPHLLDPAVWRRFAYTVEIGPPDESARRDMLTDFFGKTLHRSVVSAIAHLTEGMTGAQLRTLADDCIRDNVLNGNNISDPATSLRFVAEKLTNKVGLSNEDAVAVIGTRDEKSLNQEQLGEFFNMSQSKVSRILKAARNGRT